MNNVEDFDTNFSNNEEDIKNEKSNEQPSSEIDGETQTVTDVESDVKINDEDPEMAKSKEKIKNLEKELEAYKDKFLRLRAEYDNYRKRTEKEKSEIYFTSTALAIGTLLPVADSLSLADKSTQMDSDKGIDSNNNNEDYKKGLKMINSQLLEIFKKMEIASFGEVGEAFDPNKHNAVSHIDSKEDKHNIISEVFQKGYTLEGKIIRPAMVQVMN